MAHENILEINDLVIDYELKNYSIRATNSVSLDLKRNKITALVGESGSGKTTLATAILNIISEPGKIISGKINYFHDGSLNNELGNFTELSEKEFVTDLTKMNEKQLNFFRFQEISMVFQGAQSSLNPLMTIFSQFAETMKVHLLKKMSRKEFKSYALSRSEEVLKIVNLEPNRILNMYPHELSGGMKQRVMIAFALLLKPKLMILDEPTTALDVITQDYIFKILVKINREMNISMLLLTHDVGVVAKFSDYVGVMYAGELVEYGSTASIFRHRYHPYTNGLISATPSLLASKDSLHAIHGNPPDLRDLPTGCHFHPRCKRATENCSKIFPELIKYKDGELIRCILFTEEK